MARSSDRAMGCGALVIVGAIILVVIYVVKSVGSAAIAVIYGVDRMTSGVARWFPASFDREAGWALLGAAIGAGVGATWSLLREDKAAAAFPAALASIGLVGLLAVMPVAPTVGGDDVEVAIETRFVSTTRASLQGGDAELALLPINTPCGVLARGGTFSKVRCNDKTGFIANEQLSLERQDPAGLLAQARAASSLAETLKLAARSSALEPTVEADAVASEAFFLIELQDGLDVLRKKKGKKPPVTTARAACPSDFADAVCIRRALATIVDGDLWTQVALRRNDFCAASSMGAKLEARSGRFDRDGDSVSLRIERLSSSEPVMMQDILARIPSPGVVLFEPRRGVAVDETGRGAGAAVKIERDVPMAEGTPVILGSLDKEVIRRIVQEHASQIRYCYELELASTPGIFGKIKMKWVINGEGKVTQAQTEETQMKNSNVESCLATKIKTWIFPKPKGGGIVIVSYPFVFKQTLDASARPDDTPIDPITRPDDDTVRERPE